MGKIKASIDSEEIVCCSYCNKVDRLSEMSEIPVPNGPDDFDIELMCSKCANKEADYFEIQSKGGLNGNDR